MGMNSIGGILGPFFAGWVFDNWGSYYNAWLVLICLIFTGMLILVTIPSSKHR
jgi:uncharacterized membrane protein YeaQ/YmgE (transglycosylase-associated protein family)